MKSTLLSFWLEKPKGGLSSATSEAKQRVTNVMSLTGLPLNCSWTWRHDELQSTER